MSHLEPVAFFDPSQGCAGFLFNQAYMKTKPFKEGCVNRMKPVSCIVFVALIAGCGPQNYLQGNGGKPSQIVVSAHTQDECVEELQNEAKARGVEVKLKNVEADLVWDFILYPFYKAYKCTGEVVSPTKSAS